MFNLFMWYIMLGLVFEIIMTIVDPESYCPTDDEIREAIVELCNKCSIANLNRRMIINADGSITMYTRITFNIGFHGGSIVAWPYMLYLELDILVTKIKIKQLEKKLENLKKDNKKDES